MEKVYIKYLNLQCFIKIFRASVSKEDDVKNIHISIVSALILVFLFVSFPQAQSFDVQEPIPELTNAFITSKLEHSWNYYLKEKIFLGPTYFGNTTTFGRNGVSLHACELASDLPTYHALASKGLLRLDELNIADAPPAAQKTCSNLKRAFNVSLLPPGANIGDIDNKNNTVTFVFAQCKVENITTNSLIQTNRGIYRLVEGESRFTLRPEFVDVWAELGKPSYTLRRFRVIFTYKGQEWRDANGATKMDPPEWRVADASDGRHTAEDTGPRNGRWESEQVPPTLRDLRNITIKEVKNANVRIHNRWKENQFLNIEHGNIQSSPIDFGWWSAQWIIEPIVGTEFVRIRNKWKGDQYVNIENGRIESSPIESGWWSAQWIIEPIEGSSFVRIRNRWKGDQYLNVEYGKIQSSQIKMGWWSAQWTLESVN